MGPLMFNIFINYIFMFLDDRCTIYNYADDNTISYHDQDLVQVIRTIETSTKTAMEWSRQIICRQILPNSKPWSCIEAIKF